MTLRTGNGATPVRLADGCRLLVLDGNGVVGNTIVTMARSAGAQAAHAQSADQFFDLVRTWRPTHVAVDPIHPQPDGVDVIGRLADLTRDTGIRLIVLSSADVPIRQEALRLAAGAGLDIAGVLAKPFSVRALNALLSIMTAAPRSVRPSSPDAADAQDRISATAFDQAFARSEFDAAFQPKVRCRDGALVGFEALARWTSGGVSRSAPAIFIPAAERHRRIDTLTNVILERALSWLAQSFPGSDHTVAVNISATSLTANLLDRIEAACQRHRIEPSRLVIEITESAAVDSRAAALDLLTRMRMRGVHLSIDDFGIGYSSLMQLARLPFSELKIDRSFVAEACYSAESRAIISAIVGLAEAFGMTTVAEGVEDLDTFLLLKELGCTNAQGFFIGRPMTADRATAWSDTA
jgi:EAL domain-containing protein (putative c-di-GMP-specific phosphodiesterase class I)/FixJ family two-component response regulator